MNPMRGLGDGGRLRQRGPSDGTIASRNGNPTTTPVPRRNARREVLPRIEHDPGPLSPLSNFSRTAVPGPGRPCASGTARSSRCPSQSTRSGSCRVPRHARSSHHRHVVRLDAAAQRVGQQLLGKGLHELFGAPQERGAQVHRARERRCRPRACPTDRWRCPRSGPCAPGAHGVEVLEREAQRIHDAVAGVARRLGPVLLHDGAHRAAPSRRPCSP